MVRLVYNQRLAHQQDMITNLRAVLEEKLPVSFLPPIQRKRSKQMSFGLILIFVGLGAALLGAIILSFDKSAPPQQANVGSSGAAPQKTEAPNLITPIPAPLSPDSQRQELLKRRGQMELAVRDAEGAPIRCEFIDGQGSQLKITAGDVEYSIGVSIAGATGAWVNNTGPSVKKCML